VANPVQVAGISGGGSSSVFASQVGTWNVGITGTAAVTQSGGWTVSANQGTAAAKSSAWPFILTDSVQNQAGITAAGALKVDGSAVTQPVSGTVTANAGSGTFTVGGTVTANAGSGTFAIQATAGAPASAQLSDGAAFYVAAKTGQLPTALTGSGNLKVSLAESTATQAVSGTITANQGTAGGSSWPVALPGTVSAVNSTTVTLPSSSVFTGTSEDISGFASVAVSVFTDQNSAAGGLSPQFSSDGTHWDFAGSHTISSSIGQVFTWPAQARFWRIVYTNGAQTQGTFRLQTVYHPVEISPATRYTLQDGDANVSTMRFGANLCALNTSSQWDRMRGSVTGGLWVQGPAVTGAPVAGNPVYVGGKDGSGNLQPFTIANSRLDVNVGKIPGTISAVNSSTATLTSGSAFTGTSEDVSGYGSITINVFADQSSAAGGLSLQFSSDGTHWDVSMGLTVTLNVGASYTVAPEAQFFRVVYTNGGTNQGTFRLQTVYHQTTAQQYTFFQDVNASINPTAAGQRVMADLLIQDPVGGVTNRARAAIALVAGVGGGAHLGQAAALYDISSTKFWPMENTPSVTATTGQNLLGVGPCLWDLVGTTNFVKQAGDGSGRTMVVGPAAIGAAAAANPVLPGITDASGNVQYVKQTTAVTGTTGLGLAAAGPCLWDLVGTTSFVKQAGDGSGRAMVVGAAAAGSAVAGNPVLLAGSDNTNAQTLSTTTTSGAAIPNNGKGILATALCSFHSSSTYFPAGDFQADGNNSQGMIGAQPLIYNGVNWDRPRNNVDVTLLASAARTTTQTSADIVAYNCQAIILTLDVTATGGTISLTPTINYKDPASGKYIQLLAGTTVAATGTTTYVIDPRLVSGTPPWTKTVPSALGRIFQVVITVGNANSQTYSVGYTLVPT